MVLATKGLIQQKCSHYTDKVLATKIRFISKNIVLINFGWGVIMQKLNNSNTFYLEKLIWVC